MSSMSGGTASKPGVDMPPVGQSVASAAGNGHPPAGGKGRTVPTTAEGMREALLLRDESITLRWLEEASDSLAVQSFLLTTRVENGMTFLHMLCQLK